MTGARHAACGERRTPQETVMTQRMRFGFFLAPCHKPGIRTKAVEAATLRHPAQAARRGS